MGFGLALHTIKFWPLKKKKVSAAKCGKETREMKDTGWTKEEAEKILFWVGINQTRFM